MLLVMPQDIQAPKGRLILPQVQTLRELLDKKCMVMSVTTDKLLPALNMLQQAPKLIITDSQVFDYVYRNKPAESMLTSFFCAVCRIQRGSAVLYGRCQTDRCNERKLSCADSGMLYACPFERGYRQGKNSAYAAETIWRTAKD